MSSQKKPEGLLVSEIFCSRQGEGIETGTLTSFVRLAGCNLDCSWCDTKHSQKQNSGKPMKFAQILKELQKFPARHVCITGGEPLTQKTRLSKLMKLLHSKKYFVLIETNGSLDWTGIKASISMDLKPPSSGMQAFNNYSLLKKLGPKDCLKIVVKDRKDFDFAVWVLNSFKPEKRTNIVLQPCSNENARKLWAWCAKEPRARLMLQMHKIVWGSKKKV